MRSRRPTPQQDIVSRRLAHLSEQLALVPEPAEEEPVAVGGEWWADHTRVAEPRPALRVVAPAPPVVEPEPLPDPPGRHAARRRGVWSGAWADAVPDTLRGRVGLEPGPLAVVAAIVAIGLAFTCWRVVRGDPEAPTPVAAVSPAGKASPPLVPESAASSADVAPPVVGASEATTVTVDVAGKVRRPGIVVLPPGSRVVDAVEQAGGARAGVDLTSLNLARVLVDGEQIVVGPAGGAAPAVPPTGPGSSSAAPSQQGALVDLNLATQAELETLPGIGPVTALAIIAWREEHGGFSAVNELLEVSGIGDVTLAQLTPLVTV